jgi:hypothetical protein
MTKAPNKGQSSAIKALDEINQLIEKKQYREALDKLDEGEYKYIDFVKMAPFCRGKIIKFMREESTDKEKIHLPNDNKSSPAMKSP